MKLPFSFPILLRSGSFRHAPVVVFLVISESGSDILLMLNNNTVVHMEFETGEEKLKDLELSKFVGAGRFVVQAEGPVIVEYKISKVIKGTS